MKCPEAEKHIYLYTELSPRERDETDRHLNTCIACRQLFEAVTAQRNIIIASSRVDPELSDASRMTRRIMDALHQRKSKNASRFTIFATRRSTHVLRYAMAVVSLLLVVTFIREYTGEKEIAPYKIMAIARPAELNTSSFHAAFIAAKEDAKIANTSFYECIANCLYIRGGDCDACRKKIANLN